MEQEKKNNGSIDYMLYCDIEMYCKENELDLGKFMNKALSRGFTILAYGETPTSSKKLNKPVEVIKTVEKIVERIVKVSDDAKVNELLKDVEHLTEETQGIANLLLARDKEIVNLKKELKECNNNSKKDMYGE